MVGKLPVSLLEPSRWRTVVQRRWSHHEPIHMKEGQVALMSLRREVRRARSHGCRLLTLCGIFVSGLCFHKGRARDLGLLSLCHRSVALQLVSGIRWHLRYVESARNPSDEGSRVFPQPGTFVKRAPARKPELGGSSDGLAPLLSSTLSAQRSAPPAMHGRGVRLSRGHEEAMPADGRERGALVSSPHDAGKSEGGSSSSRAHLNKRPRFRSVLQTADLRSAKTRSGRFVVAPSVLEIFSGSSRFTSAASQKGLRVAIPFDLSNGDCFDVTQKAVQQSIAQWIIQGRV